MPSLVDKRHRRVWRVVHDSTQLAAHLQSLLKGLGLERRARDVPSLQSYIAGKSATTNATPTSDGGAG